MKRKIIEYCIIGNDYIFNFNHEIQMALIQGYQPYGNPLAGFDQNGQPQHFMQVMVKYNETVTKDKINA